MRRHKVWTSILFAMIAVGVGNGACDFWVAHRAEFAFDASRGNGKWARNSQEFIAHGIEGGMTVSQVNRLMSGAKQVGRILRATNDPDGLVCYLYTFEYANPQSSGLFRIGGPTYFLNEEFSVLFDKNGRTIGLSRVLSGTDFGITEQRIDFGSNGESARYFGPRVFPSKPDSEMVPDIARCVLIGIGLCVAYWYIERNSRVPKTYPWIMRVWLYLAVAGLWPLVLVGLLLAKWIDRHGQKQFSGEVRLPHA
jgi:hypothetical protein